MQGPPIWRHIMVDTVKSKIDIEMSIAPTRKGDVVLPCFSLYFNLSGNSKGEEMD